MSVFSSSLPCFWRMCRIRRAGAPKRAVIVVFISVSRRVWDRAAKGMDQLSLPSISPDGVWWCKRLWSTRMARCCRRIDFADDVLSESVLFDIVDVVDVSESSYSILSEAFSLPSSLPLIIGVLGAFPLPLPLIIGVVGS